ncbi:nuclear speckle RNA-binding protein B-like [Iris pallida]|uniref:Nuclear speckle RNA-binding protein B-like n=1 Tax=Iris pallida TaxID=29817 RepID=A0AAX6FYC5_IRIPA|nr:nuclear speckle RNA-binding protein B-like [Iris pallida]
MISYPPHPSPSSPSSPPMPPVPMDTNRPSPRQLQGPRPAPLKVRKDSYKINKKPPTIPPQNPNNSQHEQPPPRPPIIIYTVSPKIIHTNPSDFMTLVQRLTGPDSLSSPPSAALSPAARFAAIENADKFSPRNNSSDRRRVQEEDLDMGAAATATMCSSQPGILSPMPSSLQPIPPSFFSPISSYDPASFGFLHDLSPGPNASFFLSPTNLLATPTGPSPAGAPVWDLFNHF